MKLPDELLDKLKARRAHEPPQENSNPRLAAALKQVQEVAELAARLREANDQLEHKAAELREISHRLRTSNPAREGVLPLPHDPEPDLPAPDQDGLRLRLAASAAEIGTWQWDLVKAELEWSERCKAIFGLAADRTMSYPVFLTAIHQEDRATVDQALRQALQGDGQICVEMRVALADGSVRRVLCKGRVFFDPQGKPLRLAGIALDVTARTNTASTRTD